MSYKYDLYTATVKLSGFKEYLSLPGEKMREEALQRGERSPFSVPASGKYRYEEKEVEYGGETGQYLYIPASSGAKRGAVLYIYGNGLLLPPLTSYARCAARLGDLSGRDVYFPLYPLLTDHRISDMVGMIRTVYERMLEDFKPGEIFFYGFSGGAALGMMVMSDLKERGIPMPGGYIGISPGRCPVLESTRRKMQEIEKRDVQLTAGFIEELAGIMRKGDPEAPEYMITGKGLSMEGYPPCYLYFGGDEVLSAQEEEYRRDFERCGVPYRIVVREEMCHCYCIDTKFPEAEEDYREIISVLSGKFVLDRDISQP